MYKPRVNLYEHASIVIWIVTQEFASLFWKSALTCISWTQPRAASKGMRHYWNHQRTTGQAESGNEPISHFHFGPQKQRKTIMREVQQRSSPRSQGNPSSIRKFIPWQDPATGWPCTAPVPSFSERCSKTWKCWSLDKMIKRLHHREHKCKHYPWVCYFAVKVQYKPLYLFPPTILLLGFFVFFFLFFHKSTYNKICTERS